jgi:heat shock protein HtpX
LLYEQIAQNKHRTWLMIAIFLVVIFGVAWFATYLLRFGAAGIAIAAVFAVGSAVFGYYNSDKIALAASRAKPVDEALQQGWIDKLTAERYHNLVENLCIAAGLPQPRLYVINDPAPNAFATGRDPKHSAVAVTTGLFEKMNRVELEGVLAHELSHVKNYDILIATLAVTMVGTIVLLSDIFLRWSFWGGMNDDRRDSNDSPVGAILAIVGIVFIVVAPIIAKLMQLAVSRQREYLADVSGVQLTRYPPGLISALEKLKDDHTVIHTASKATAHMWIEDPLEDEDADHKRARKFDNLFSTHPPLDDRIARLREL